LLGKVGRQRKRIRPTRVVRRWGELATTVMPQPGF
jgi:hypothetical protein